MVILSIDYAKKLRQIRKAEGLTQKQFADITGLSLATIRNYESGQKNARAKIVEAVLQVDRFEKYMLWLIKDKTLPVAGQIAPALSLWIYSVGGRSGFNRHYPKITPIRPQCWLTLHIERITSRKECLVNLSVGGANHVD